MSKLIIKEEFHERFEEIALNMVDSRGLEKAMKFKSEVQQMIEDLSESPKILQITEYPFRVLMCDKKRHHVIYVYDEKRDRMIVVYIIQESQDKTGYYQSNKTRYKKEIA